MSDDFDPYLEWLGIEPHERPINHYRLLGITPLTTDLDAIRRAADERMSKVRQYQMGRRGSHTQPILNALSSAKLCLLNPNTKASYDAVLSASLGMHQSVSHLTRHVVPEPPVASEPVAPPPPPPPAPPLTESPPPVPPPLHEPVRSSPPSVPAAGSDYHSASRLEKRSSGMLPVALLVGVVVLAASAWFLYHVIQQQQPTAPVAHQPPAASPPSEAPTAPVSPAPVANDPPTTSDPESSVVIRQEGGGSLQFRPSAAELSGSLKLENVDSHDAITGFASTDDQAVWQFHLTQPGAFRARIEYAAQPGGGSSAFRLVSPGNFDRERAIRSDATGTVTDAFIVAIKRSGDHYLAVVPQAISGDQQFRVFSVELIPTRGGQ